MPRQCVKQIAMENALKAVYPRALSYTDLWNQFYIGRSPMDRNNISGGSTMRTLVKNGKAKQITIGYYCWIPNNS